MQTKTFTPTEIQFMAMLGWVSEKEQAFIWDHLYWSEIDNAIWQNQEGIQNPKIRSFEELLKEQLKLQDHEYC